MNRVALPKVQASEGEFERADEEAKRLQHEADALQLLETTLAGIEAGAKAAYFEPISRRLRPRIQRLFGTSELSFKDEFSLDAFERGGVREDIAELSDGTREQLSILVRVAFAEVLAENGIPRSAGTGRSARLFRRWTPSSDLRRTCRREKRLSDHTADVPGKSICSSSRPPTNSYKLAAGKNLSPYGLCPQFGNSGSRGGNTKPIGSGFANNVRGSSLVRRDLPSNMAPCSIDSD